MLNKDLLFSQGLQGWGAYTHIVLVENPSNWIFRGFNATGGYGSIAPGAYFDYDTPIERLGVSYSSAYDETQLKTGGYFLPDPQLIYLGRSDTKKLMGTPSKYSEKGGYVYWRHQVLFTEEDLGKEVPIWLSYTPPRGSNPLYFKQLFNLSEGCLDVQQRYTTRFKQQANGAVYRPLCENAGRHKAYRFVAKWKELGNSGLRGNTGSSDQYKNYNQNDFCQLLCSYVFKRIKQCRDFISRSARIFVFTSHRYKPGRNYDLRQLALCASHTMGGAYA